MRIENATAIYCRLSKDDEKIGESVSIETQRMMLTHFCKEKRLGIFDYYIDDGFSGLNFQRPSFQKMLTDIESGLIDTVITKDLSRLGRDYIQTGYYIEIFFRERNVRYIALNDNIDTLQEDNDVAPFKNILNDMYAHDLSRKVKAAKKQRALRGYFISGQAPYGYKIDPENNNHLIVDPVPAFQVKAIFDLAKNGDTLRSIAASMTEKGILTPGAYKAMNGDTRFQRFLSGNPNKWCAATISQILKDSVYLGHMVNHKGEVKNYKTKERRTVPKNEWIVVENTHEPIIEKEVFDQVQAILLHKSHSPKAQFDNVLDGYVYCGECGHPLTQATKKNKSGTRYLLRCTNHFANPTECKHNHAVFYDMLMESVKQSIIEHLHSAGKEIPANGPITRSAILQWIDYIEIGQAPFDESEEKNRVVVHYKDHSRHRPKGKNANRFPFYGW